MTDVPVVVIGTGPAGSAAALALGQQGVAALALEQGAEGKDKVCGDALVGSAIESIGRFGVTETELSDLGATSFAAIDFVTPEHHVWRVPQPQADGWIIPRATIDQRLRDEMARSCEVRYETAAQSVVPGANGSFRVDVRRRRSNRIESVTCCAVVVAAGSTSRIGRAWSIDGCPVLAASVSAYAKSADSPFEAPAFEFADPARPGYSWAFPAGEVSNIGVCLFEQPHGSRLRRLGEDFASRRGFAPLRWRGGAAAIWSGAGHRWHDETGIVSCGDAAALIDPFTGEGISAALASGREAGLAAARYLKSGNPEYLSSYSTWLRRHFEAEYQRTPARTVWATLCGLAE